MRLRPFLLTALLASVMLGGCGDPPSTEEDAGEELPVEDQDAGTGDAGTDFEPPPPTTFRMMTWNVENLFDEYNDPATDDTVVTRSEADARLDEVAKVIKAAGIPEVIALQEVENLQMLKRLADRLGSGLNTVLVDANDPRGIDVGLITKFPVTRHASHAGENVYDLTEQGKYYRYARDCLEVHLDVGGHPLVVLVNHLVSKASSGSDSKRQAEAAKTRDIADFLRAEEPRRAVIIAGDMNDTPDSPPLKQFLRTPDFVDVAASSPCTFKFGASCFRYDYLLPDKHTAETRADIKVIKTSDATKASDHSPVMATFTLAR